MAMIPSQRPSGAPTLRVVDQPKRRGKRPALPRLHLCGGTSTAQALRNEAPDRIETRGGWWDILSELEKEKAVGFFVMLDLGDGRGGSLFGSGTLVRDEARLRRMLEWSLDATTEHFGKIKEERRPRLVR